MTCTPRTRSLCLEIATFLDAVLEGRPVFDSHLARFQRLAHDLVSNLYSSHQGSPIMDITPNIRRLCDHLGDFIANIRRGCDPGYQERHLFSMKAANLIATLHAQAQHRAKKADFQAAADDLRQRDATFAATSDEQAEIDETTELSDAVSRLRPLPADRPESADDYPPTASPHEPLPRSHLQ